MPQDISLHETMAPTSDKPQAATAIPPSDPDLESRLEQLTELMRRIFRVVRMPEEHVDLTPTQLLTLSHLDVRGALRIGALAHALGAAQNTVSEVVSRMVRSGMVLKERDPADNRAVIVRLGPPGKAALEQHRAGARRANRELLEALTPDQQKRLLESFEMMVSLVERAREPHVADRREARRKQ